jgi:hypothetical protein
LDRFALNMKFTPILASDFGAIGLASTYGFLLLVAGVLAVLALTLAMFRRTRRVSIWVSSLALLAGLLLFAFYFGVLRQEHPDWIIIPLSLLPSIASSFALCWGLRFSRTARDDSA